MLRCSLRKKPSSSLVSDCITAMAEGLQSCFYCHFVSLFWSISDASCQYSSSHTDSEWESFSYEIRKVCAKYGQTLPTVPPSSPSKAWDFLINSKYHAQYCKRTPTSYDSMFPVSYSTCSTVFKPFLQDEHSSDASFYIQFMKETLETLHALYENLKLNILRKE
jgi:anaphase-promoting complex subunit 1